MALRSPRGPPEGPTGPRAGPRLPGTAEKRPPARRPLRSSKHPCCARLLCVNRTPLPAPPSAPHPPGHLAQDLRGLGDPGTPPHSLAASGQSGFAPGPRHQLCAQRSPQIRQGPSVRPWHLAAFCQNPGHSVLRAGAPSRAGLTPESWAAPPGRERHPASRHRCTLCLDNSPIGSPEFC